MADGHAPSTDAAVGQQFLLHLMQQHQGTLALQAQEATPLDGAPGSHEATSPNDGLPNLGSLADAVAAATAVQAADDGLSQGDQPQQKKRGRPKKAPGEGSAAALALPRRPQAAIKTEVYENLEDRFQEAQAELNPKRHRGNPKGYQIKPFCKNPACGKPLPGGRCNKCPACGFDLAQHRKEQQLQRLLKSGKLQPAAAKNLLRDAANETHVRTGGKAAVLTLVYIEGANNAPAQAIAFGKPAVSMLESKEDLLTEFESVCKSYFEAQNREVAQRAAAAAAAAVQAAQSNVLAAAVGVMSAAPLGLDSLPLAPPPGLPSILNNVGSSSLGTPLEQAAIALDLSAVLASTLAAEEAQMAIDKCQAARLDGDVLCKLPQPVQLQLLMQAGLLAGDAARVLVEINERAKAAGLLAM